MKMKFVRIGLISTLALGCCWLEAKMPMPTKEEVWTLQTLPKSEENFCKFWKLGEAIRTNAYEVSVDERDWIGFQMLTNLFSNINMETGAYKGTGACPPMKGYGDIIYTLISQKNKFAAYCEVADYMGRINVISTNVYMRERSEAIELDRPGLMERRNLPYAQRCPHGAAWLAKWGDEIKRNDARKRMRDRAFNYFKGPVARFLGDNYDQDEIPTLVSNIAVRAKMTLPEQQQVLDEATRRWRDHQPKSPR